METRHRLFAWNFSYFSAKVRAYLRYKQFNGALEYEEIFASQEIIQGYMIPATGSNVVPQVQTPDGEWLQDSSEIIDLLESAHPEAPVIPGTPRQKLVSYLIELIADEWMLPWGFWERWHYTQEGVEPNHEAFNAFQWGRMFNPEGSGSERLAAGRFVFDEMMKVNDPDNALVGPFVGLPQLGVTDKTEQAWTDSMHNILGLLEAHFDQHDYILGGQPTLADFSLIGPLYPHLYKDPVPGFMMRTEFPMVSEWIERVNGSTEAGSSSYREPRYKLEDGNLVRLVSTTLLPDDEIPDTLLPIIHVFFDEMWPMLKRNIHVVRQFIEQSTDGSLPGKSFHSSAEFRGDQSGEGALTLEFNIGGVTERRMASPYQVWMLQRLARTQPAAGTDDANELKEFLQTFEDGTQLLDLDRLLGDCLIVKNYETLTAKKSGSE
ncbi:MAG: glutathione S-transferase [Candidatus Azotimanducaceae bacterium]|jgi:glutathione S-transferase